MVPQRETPWVAQKVTLMIAVRVARFGFAKGLVLG
jgi:hypothetical protein